MGILIAGILVITTLLISASIMTGSFLNTSVDQVQALKELAVVNKRLAGTALNITSASVDTPGSGDLTVTVDNTGSESVIRFKDMDVILQYTDEDDKVTLTYLDYTDSGLSNNQWTVPTTGVQPNTFNPQVWDSDETLTLDLKVDPAIKSGTPGVVVVGMPLGVTDQTALTNP